MLRVSSRMILASFGLSAALLSGCAKDPAAEGEPFRPEISALPPELQASARATPAPAPTAAARTTAETWNEANIAWEPYEAGLAHAKAEKKPVCIVLYTGWCPHCRNYSHVFEDARVVEKAKRFVMIRANADEQPAIAGKYATDGGYVPRTYFLAPDGTVAPEIHAPRPKFQYFYDERDPGSILGGMDAALAKLGK